MRQGGGEEKALHTLVYSPSAPYPGLGQAKSRSWELHPGFLDGLQESECLGHQLLLLWTN